MFDSWNKISKVKRIARQVSRRALSHLTNLQRTLEIELRSAGIQTDSREIADFQVEFLAFYLHMLERLLVSSLGSIGMRVFIDWMENSLLAEASGLSEYSESHRLIQKELRLRYTNNESALCELPWITTQEGGSARESVVGVFAILEAERLCGRQACAAVVKPKLIADIQAAYVRLLSEKPNAADLFICEFGLG